MLSIVIVNWKTCGHLRRCLQSLETHGLGEEMRVIVVDNASGDVSAEMVASEFAWVRLVALERNVGSAKAQALRRVVDLAADRCAEKRPADIGFVENELPVSD